MQELYIVQLERRAQINIGLLKLQQQVWCCLLLLSLFPIDVAILIDPIKWAEEWLQWSVDTAKPVSVVVDAVELV